MNSKPCSTKEPESERIHWSYMGSSGVNRKASNSALSYTDWISATLLCSIV